MIIGTGIVVEQPVRSGPRQNKVRIMIYFTSGTASLQCSSKCGQECALDIAKGQGHDMIKGLVVEQPVCCVFRQNSLIRIKINIVSGIASV